MTTTESHHDVASHAGGHEAGHSGRPVYDDVNVTSVLMVGICSTIITVLIIAVVQGLCYRWESGVFNTLLQDRANQVIQESIAAQKAILSSTEGEGRITIDDAMKRIVEQYGKADSGSGGHSAGGESEH